MSLIRKLAGQTALYGLSSMVGRFLNYLLVPLHTARFEPEVYGIITEFYSYTAFLIVILPYGMETAFFRFSLNRDKETVYSNALGAILATTTLFVAAAFLMAGPLSRLLEYPGHPEYVMWFAAILGLDAITAIPMARLRDENRAGRFAAINIISMLVNIGANIFYIGYCMQAYEGGNSNWITDTFYNPAIGVGYVFIANLMASAVKCLLLLPEFLRLKYLYEKALLQQMLKYGIPLMLAGLAGIINETFSRGFFKYFLQDRIGTEAAMYQLGVFGAVYKLSVLITLFIQAYRYAAEPFFFKQSQEKAGKEFYVRMMNYFVFIVFSMFLVVSLFLEPLSRLFLNDVRYWEGLGIVPVLLAANAFLGISYNLSVWYKLSGKTMYGAYIAAVGAAITIVLNWLLIPLYGYAGAAWATFACYTAIMVLSYTWGQKHYPIPYQLGKIVVLLVLALLLYFTDFWMNLSGLLAYAVKVVFLLIFAGVFLRMEKPALLFKRR